MKKDKERTADAVRIACCAVLAALFFSTALFARPAQVGAADAVPGAGIGQSDGDVDGDGMVEGPREEPASDIGDGIGMGIEEIKDGLESIASDMIGGEGTEGTGRGPVETDPGVVRDTTAYGMQNGKKTNVEKESADTLWVVAAVVAAVAAVAALAVALPKRTVKKEEPDEKPPER